MSLFPCAACAAKDAEIARLWKAVTEANDRFQALTGTLSEVANNRDVPATTANEPPDKPTQTDAQWEAEQLADAEVRAERHRGGIVRDFPE